MKIQLRWIWYTVIILLSAQLPLHAQDASSVKYAYIDADSTNLRHISPENIINVNSSKKEPVTAINLIAETYLKRLDELDINGKKHNARSVAELIGTNEFKEAANNKKHAYKFYYHLANIFTRLKMYKLAMKCYFKTLPVEELNITATDITPDSAISTPGIPSNYQITTTAFNIQADTSVAGLLAINKKDEQALIADSGIEVSSKKTIESKPELMANILDPFDDGKKASAYAIMVHIQQPVSGKRKIYIKLNKVGHTFITLIKYNTDSTSVSRSFGFYPKKDHFLSATPLFPSSTSVFKNDESHAWDETIGKFITERKFKKILEVIKEYDQKRYNLNKNNCTDFGLNLAGTAGIKIMNTTGSWPLGHGNNPASAGQSVLEGKVVDTDGVSSLFICNDLDVVN